MIKVNKFFKINLSLKRSLFFILMLFFSTLSFSENGYIIKNYNIDININENNQYRVKEDISALFQIEKRGIIRSLPTRYGNRNIHLSDIKVNAPFSLKNYSTGTTIRIGDPNRYLKGLQNYILTYDYNMGWDKNNNYDEVYYNLIGNEWDTTIDNLTFSITLPKKFNTNKINFTVGNRGSRNNDIISYHMVGNTIIGSTNRPLRPGEAVTLALPLPENYFNVTTPIFLLNFLKYLINSLAILFIFLPFIAWYKFGRNNPLIETVEFYPPDNMNPSEVGYFIDGSIDVKDITSLIIYWADKGLLNISEEGKDGLFSKKEYFLEKKKDIQAKNSYEPYFFNSIFTFSDEKNIVSISSLKNIFYKYIEKTSSLLGIDLAMNHKALYNKKSLSIGAIISFLPIILIVLTIIRYAVDMQINYFSTELLLGILTIPSVVPLVIPAFILCFFIGPRIKQRTPEYSAILGKIKGFKRFLETAEKNKLEMLIDENPSYFYNILPYTIVLGVSDKWADKFQDLVKEPPNWYHSSSMNLFTMGLFMASFNNTLGNMTQNMYSTPPSNNGPGLSSMGGGSAGGGAGGGGGSSW